jgi:hypothetical protein
MVSILGVRLQRGIVSAMKESNLFVCDGRRERVLALPAAAKRLDE